MAADAPEITASVTAVVHHQAAVGAGVTTGSKVFNLAALLGCRETAHSKMPGLISIFLVDANGR